MEIGLFQLENLFLTRNQYCLLDLRDQTGVDLGPTLRPILAQAVRLKSELVLSYVTESQMAKEFPIILICEKGRQSQKAATQLEAKGYKNVYVVAGGTEGLLSEL
jgi:rhodanese-related sulfurtransferase